jgi:catechol 2,3-dioxygenase-like lactoylglutathione lyase family enzyme
MRFAVLVALVLATGCSGKKTERESPLVAEAKRCGASGSEMECARPIIRVASLLASQAYYREKLGFKVDWEHGEPPDFGSVSRGDYVLFMCEQCQSAAGAWSMTFMHDVDKYYDELKHRGAIIRQPPTDMPWGLREMHIADPDGNVIRFGSHGDHD